VSHEGWNEARGKQTMLEVPAWARDNLVLRLLDDQGLRLDVVYDKKYLDGLCNRPLIVIRRKPRARK
jgi:hypothetical protein